MRQLIIIASASLLLMCSTAQTSNAQENINKDEARFGIKGGPSFSNLYTQDAKKDKILLGFNVGLFAKLPVSKFIAIQPELYFVTKGSEVTYDNALVNGTARYHFNYVELPIMLVMNILPNFNIQAGAYAAYMVSGKVTNESSSNAFNFEDNINTDDYNRFDAGLALGAGLDLGGMGIGARYTHGLTNVGKEKNYFGSQSYTFPDAHNGVLSLYLSIALN
jgi:hypothetical protein